MVRLTEEDKEDIRTADALAQLLKVHGWKVYMALLDARIAEKRMVIEKACGSVDEMVSKEWHKGALAGLRLAREAVDNIVAAANALRAKMDPDEDV